MPPALIKNQQHTTETEPIIEDTGDKAVIKQKMSEILQMKTMKDLNESTLLKVSDIPQKKQKKTLKRLHHVGKSKFYKKIGNNRII